LTLVWPASAAGPEPGAGQDGLGVHREVLQSQGVPVADDRAAPFFEGGQPFVGDLWEKLEGDRVVRSVYGWIPLPGKAIQPELGLGLKPALIARALPGVTGVELVATEEACSVFTLRLERTVLRRPRSFHVRMQRCGTRVGDGLRWVSASQEIARSEAHEPATLPAAFVEAVEVRPDPRYGWLLGIRRVELGRRLGPVFSGIYHDELRAELARALRHGAPVLAGERDREEIERTSLIE
jgi:hypothetical protein